MQNVGKVTITGINERKHDTENYPIIRYPLFRFWQQQENLKYIDITKCFHAANTIKMKILHRWVRQTKVDNEEMLSHVEALMVSRRRHNKSRNRQIAGDILASQFQRFTNKARKLNFVYDDRIYYANRTELRFKVLQETESKYFNRPIGALILEGFYTEVLISLERLSSGISQRRLFRHYCFDVQPIVLLFLSGWSS